MSGSQWTSLSERLPRQSAIGDRGSSSHSVSHVVKELHGQPGELSPIGHHYGENVRVYEAPDVLKFASWYIFHNSQSRN